MKRLIVSLLSQRPMMSDPASEEWYKFVYLPQQEVQKSVTTWDFVREDITAREDMGAKKYNKYLTPRTDENMLQHLYEELLDATVYIKTLILQQNSKAQK